MSTKALVSKKKCSLRSGCPQVTQPLGFRLGCRRGCCLPLPGRACSRCPPACHNSMRLAPGPGAVSLAWRCPSCSPCLELVLCVFATGPSCLTLVGRGSHASVASWGLLTSSSRSKLKCKAAWNAVTFQFGAWAAYLAPRLRAQWHDTPGAGLGRQHPNCSVGQHYQR